MVWLRFFWVKCSVIFLLLWRIDSLICELGFLLTVWWKSILFMVFVGFLLMERIVLSIFRF